jgi:tellurite methyltransferase
LISPAAWAATPCFWRGGAWTRRGWDLSPVAIAKLGDHAKTQGLSVCAEVRDVQSLPPEPDSFDVIVVSYFLERELAPAVVRALRPEGLYCFYQTWTREAVDDRGPGKPGFPAGGPTSCSRCSGI